jgi:hypothetical protein
MSDQRRRWIRDWLIRLGRAALTGLTAVGSCWCAGYLAASASPRSLPLDGDADDGDVDVHDEAMRGIAEIEVYLAAADPPTRRPHSPKRHRRRELP